MNKKIKKVPGSRVFGPKYNFGGRPTKYDDEVLAKTLLYLSECERENEIPYVQELGLILGVDDETIAEWAKKKNEDGSLSYPEFSATVKRIKQMQELKLLRSSMYGYSATGSIFQLKANHGYVETEKRIVEQKVEAEGMKELAELTKAKLEQMRGRTTTDQQ